MANAKSPAAVQALQNQLMVRCDYSNWWIARQLLREQWKHKPQVLRNTSTDLRELPFVGAAIPVKWRRELQPHMVGWWVHHYDKNSHYLSAGRSVKCGVGDPDHLVASHHDIIPGLPGIYRLSHVKRNTSAFDGTLFPRVIEDGQEWVTNDVLLFAGEYGYTYEIEEAHVFPDYTRVLEKWSAKVWNTRQYFNPKLHTVTGLTPEVQQECYDNMKDIAVRGNGSWATSKEKMFDKESLDLIHPNWWGDVAGKARVNILANILKYGAPVLIRTDGLWFITRDDNYRSAVPGILERMNECGGYKHEASFQLTHEVYQQARGLENGDLSHLFKITGGEITEKAGNE